MNKENLLRLAEFLETVPPRRFCMSYFATDEHGETLDIQLRECGTAACAVGWGPAAGIPPLPGDASWTQYSERVFGLDPHQEYGAWDWCFSGIWVEIDNTPAGAAKRIRHLVENGLPRNARSQILGTAPYLFAQVPA